MIKKRFLALKWFLSGFKLGFSICSVNFKTRYRQSFLGVLWAIINPLLFAAVFFFLNNAGVINPGNIDVPYPLYTFAGVMLWSLFSSIITKIAGIPVYSSDILTLVNLNRAALISAQIFEPLIEFLIKFILLLLFSIIYGVFPSSVSFLLFLLSIIPIILFAAALGFLLGAFSGITRDIVKALPLFLNLLMFLTPVVYTTLFRKGFLGFVSTVNPVSHMLDFSRNLIFNTSFDITFSFVISVTVSILFFVEFLYLFRISLPISVERI